MDFNDIRAGFEKIFALAAIPFGFAAVLLVLLLIARMVWPSAIARPFLLALVCFVFGALAMATGVITGASRTSVVGDMLPAVLTFIGAVALYVITKSPEEIPLAAVAVISFSFMLLFGTVLGSYERLRGIAYEEARQYDPARLRQKADIEFAINGYRRSRGLAEIVFEGVAPR